jgi:hypothetical protein
MSNALGSIRGNPLANGSSQRQSAESKLRNAKSIGESQKIPPQQLNRIFAGGRVGSSMATYIVLQHLEVAQKIGCLRVPHGVVSADRVRKD